MPKFPQHYHGWKIIERLTPYDHYFIATKNGTAGTGKNKLAANLLKDLKAEIEERGYE